MTATLEDVLAGTVPPGSKIRCPSPDHDDFNPSAVFYEDGHVHCFACGFHAFDPLDAVRKALFPDQPMGRSLAEAYLGRFGELPLAKKPTRQRSNRPPAHALAAMTLLTELANAKLKADPLAADAIARDRGLRDPVGLGLGISGPEFDDRIRQSLSRMGYSPSAIDEAMLMSGLYGKKTERYRLGRRLIIPERRSEGVVFYQARALWPQDAPKYLNPAVSKPVYGLASLDREGTVFVAEGSLDALPLIESGHPAVAVLGATYSSKAFEELRELLIGRDVVVAFDGDATGLERGQELAKELGGVLVPPPKAYKDWGEWITDRGVDEVVATASWVA